MATGDTTQIDELTTERVRVTRSDDVVTITLVDERRRNPLSRATIGDLHAAFDGSSDAHAIVLASTGPVWSTGHDLREMSQMDETQLRDLFDACSAMMRAVENAPQPFVAKVSGLATAAGCQLVATCDVVVASDDARFCTPGGKGGLFCHTPMVAVARAIGRRRAAEMAMTGDEIDATTAADWGLINRAVPAAELDDATAEMVRRLTRGSRHAKAVGKQTLYRQMDERIDDAYRLASDMMVAGASAGDGREGTRAFAEKRPPEFSHRS